MEKNLESQDIKIKIREFYENKNFKNPFIQECITDFIEEHINLYGDVVSTEALFKRLKDNLDRITFAGSEKAPNGELGEYKGRIADNIDINEVFIYFNESDLELSSTDKKMWNLYTESDKQKLIQDVEVKKSKIKSTLIHELTHSAYTIKNEYGIGEKHIFSETSKDYLSGEYRQIGGNNIFVEGIVNYIASRIEGKNPDEIETYQAETKAVYMMSKKVGEKSIIVAAWNSDEQHLRQSYIDSMKMDINTSEKSYNLFKECMKRLVVIREQNMNLGEQNRKNESVLSEMQQILDEKSHGIESSKFKDIEHSTRIEKYTSSKAPLMESNLSFTQKVARFFEKHKVLMNIPFIRNFTDKQLNVLPPAREQEEKNISSFNDKRNNFINELSNNGEYRKLEPIKNNEERQDSGDINRPIVEKDEK